MDKRSFITIQTGQSVIHVATNRSKAFEWMQAQLISEGIDIDEVEVRVSSVLGEVSIPRRCYYGAFRDLVNAANPDFFEGVDFMLRKKPLYRLQRHLANGGL